MNDSYIGYIRVSNKEHDTSIPAQREKLKSYARNKGLNLVIIYEESKSAFKENNRKVFNQMIEHLRDDKVKGVIFHKIDRSSRNPREFATLESFFDIKDIRVIEGEFDTSSAIGKLSFRMFSSLAIFYSQNLSEEVTLKMKERLKLGYYPSCCPYGYRTGTEQDIDVKMKYPNENAPFVKTLFSKYATGAYTYNSLGKFAREKGVRFYKDHIEGILNNPFYAGTIRWRSKKTGKVAYYEGNHEPIISKALFDEVQRIKAERTVSTGIRTKTTYSKFMECQCGRSLYWEKPTNGSKQKKYCYLRCRNNECPFTSLREDELEAEVIKQLNAIFLRFTNLEKSNKKLQAKPKIRKLSAQKATSDINTQLSKLKKKLDNLQEDYLERLFERNEFVTKRDKYKAQIKELEKSLAKIKNTKKGTKSVSFTNTKQLFAKLAQTFKNGNTIKKRQILNLCFSNGKIINGKAFLLPSTHLQGVANVPYFTTGWENAPVSQKNLEQSKATLCDEVFQEIIEEI